MRTPSEIEALEQQIGAVQVTFTGDMETDGPLATAAIQALQEILAAADALPETLRSPGGIRVADAHLKLADSLMNAPCPAELMPAECNLYRGQLAEQAEPLVLAATLGAAMVETELQLGTDELSVADRDRLAQVLASAAEASARVEEWKRMLPPPPGKRNRPPRPVPQAAGQPDPGWAAPPAEAADGARFCLVWGNAELRRSVDDAEPIRIYDYADDVRAAYPEAIYLVEVLGESEGGLLEVRLGGDMDWNRQCTGNTLGAHWTALRMWIDPGDRVEVLAAEVAVEHPDGTGVRLMPGTPLLGDWAWLNGQLVPLPAGAERAQVYTLDAPRLEQVFGKGRIPWTAEGTLGGAPFAIRQPAIDRTADLGVSTWESTDEGALVRYTRRCGEFRFLLDGPEPDESQSEVFGTIGGLMGNAKTVRLPAGTRLHWADGRPAGQVGGWGASLESWQFYGDAMRCVGVPMANTLGGFISPTVPICVRPEDMPAP